MKDNRSLIPRRVFLTSAAVGLAGVGVVKYALERVLASAVEARRERRLYVMDLVSERLALADASDAPWPHAAVRRKDEAIRGYASKFTYHLGEDVELYFPAQGEECRSHRGAGCRYSDRVSFPAAQLGPGVYRCKYFVGIVGHEAVFSVVDAGRAPDVCLLYPSTTYQAYNTTGGESLYTVGTLEPSVVSMRRPLGAQDWYHDPRFNYADRLLSHMGVDFFAIDNVELHRNPGVLDAARLLVLAQHDEYWSFEMRRAVENFLRRGGSLLCLAGNVMFWKVRIEGDDVVVRKISPTPAEGELESWTGRWNRILPEESTMGLSWRHAGYPVKREFESYAALVERVGRDALTAQEYAESDGLRVLAPDHPVFAGTGLAAGESFGHRDALLSVEIDGLPLTGGSSIDRGRAPAAPAGTRPLALGVAGRHGRLQRFGTMVDFRFEGRGRVLSFGSIGWVKAAHAGGDPQVARVTRNAVELLLAEGRTASG